MFSMLSLAEPERNADACLRKPALVLQHVKFRSISEETKKFEDWMLKTLEDQKFVKSDIFAIVLALKEALDNAIKHGNQKNENKNVEVLFTITDKSFEAHIHDEGEPFDPTEIPDCTDPENMERPSGRGVLLMRSYMSQVEFPPLGKPVMLRKFWKR